LEIEGQQVRLDRRKVLLGALAVPLLSCTASTISDSGEEIENPIGNPPLAPEKSWDEFVIASETELINSVDFAITRVNKFENELREIRAHHLEHLRLYSDQPTPTEAVFNSVLGNGNFSELANLRIKHARNVNLIKNNLKEISQPALITTFVQIAACDHQVVNLLADLMTQVFENPSAPAVSSG
jgi:hypothetical protein